MIKVSHMINLIDNGFGVFNHEVVELLLNFVEDSYRQIGIESAKSVFVCHTTEEPMCCVISDGNLHCIKLNTEGDYWCQWVYQFAHEYCHHLIDGSLSGEWSDMLWFEETICELSSLYNLNRMIKFCMMNGLQGYAPSVDEYLRNLLTKNKDTCCLYADGGCYKQYEDSLRVKQYQRDLYNAIAVMMYPLFMENPRLWKMIMNIGDIRLWSSLDDLFTHLEANADDSYRDSLRRLRQMFS